MPHPWQYTRSRRLIMQGVMWGILGAAAGGAALVDRGRNEANRPRLTMQYARLHSVEVRLPEGWTVSQKGVGSPDDISIEANELLPGRRRTVRQLVVREMKARPRETAGEFLLRYLSDEADGDTKLETIDFSGRPGKITTVTNHEGIPVWGIFAAAALGDEVGVVLQLTGIGQPSSFDRELMETVAHSVAVAPGPEGESLPQPSDLKPLRRPVDHPRGTGKGGGPSSDRATGAPTPRAPTGPAEPRDEAEPPHPGPSKLPTPEQFEIDE